jgi:hypothetical protein
MANLPPNQSAIMSGGYSPWQAPLAALFSGISAAAQPGGFANFGQGVQQGQQNFQQGQQQQQMMDLRRMQMEQAQEEMRRANQEREQAQAQQDRIRQSIARLTGSPTPTEVQPVGNYGAATGGIQTASGAPGGQLAAIFGGDQQKAALFSEYAEAYPEQAYQMLVERGFAEPEQYEASSPIGKLRADLQAGLIDQQTYDALIKKETYIAPREGPAQTERYRNAVAAGLIPGTPEFQQYILGRDDTAPGPFQGTGLDAQSFNIVLTGDPTKPEYAAAFMQLAQPKTQLMPDGTVQTVAPDMSWARKPGGAAAAAAPTPAPGQQTTQLPGATVTTVPGSGVTPQDRNKLRGVKAEATAIKQALTDFKTAIKGAPIGQDFSAVTGGFTEGGRKLNSAWTNAAIMTKAEALFNLGVLNGPDLGIIQGTLPNPSTASGFFTSEAAYEAAVDTVIKLIDQKVSSFEAQYGGTPYTRGGGDAPSDDGWTTLPSGVRIRRKN